MDAKLFLVNKCMHNLAMNEHINFVISFGNDGANRSYSPSLSIGEFLQKIEENEYHLCKFCQNSFGQL